MSTVNKDAHATSGKQVDSHDFEINPSSDTGDATAPAKQRRSFRSFIWDTDTHLKTTLLSSALDVSASS
jgi:hypothetical protein